MVALLAAFALAGPPRAFLHTGSTQVRLAVSSWCWRGHCGAPISASKKIAVAAHGSLVAVELTFTPTRARVEIAGRPVTVVIHGHERKVQRVQWSFALIAASPLAGARKARAEEPQLPL